MHKFLIYFLFLSALMMAQKNTNNSVKRFYYRDSVVSMERFTGRDKNLDSLKTYYSDGKLSEVFYYDEKGFMHSNCYQLNKEGEKLVSWNFLHGKLISRTDHKLPFNKVNEEKVKEKLQNLIEINQKTNYNPTSINDLCRRGNLRAGLGNTILALEDLIEAENCLNKISKNTTSSQSETVIASREKFESYLYDLIANVYSHLEMENYAVVYYLKAIAAAPNDTRILYNFANSQEKKNLLI